MENPFTNTAAATQRSRHHCPSCQLPYDGCTAILITKMTRRQSLAAYILTVYTNSAQHDHRYFPSVSHNHSQRRALTVRGAQPRTMFLSSVTGHSASGTGSLDDSALSVSVMSDLSLLSDSDIRSPSPSLLTLDDSKLSINSRHLGSVQQIKFVLSRR